jgi:uncharacterized membrane protein
MPQSASVGTATTAARNNTAAPWWLKGIVVLAAVLLAAGAVIALVHPIMLVSPHDQINDAVRVYAGYLASRNLGLAIFLLAALALGGRKMLANLMLLTAFIQLLDAAIDCFEGRWAVLPGVIVLGIIFFVGAARLSGHGFWRIEAWRQGD